MGDECERRCGNCLYGKRSQFGDKVKCVHMGFTFGKVFDADMDACEDGWVREDDGEFTAPAE